MSARAVPRSGEAGQGLRAPASLVLAAVLAVILGPGRVAAQAPGQPAGSGGGTGEVVKLINTTLAASWKENKVTPSAPADDHEFIRRASLDIIGRIATPREIEEFLKQPQESRRAWLVERLLKSEDYAKHWANLWTTWLLTRSGVFGRGQYHEQMQTWLEDQFAQNRPLNQLATALITAEGKNTENGAVNFVLAHVGDPVPAPDVPRSGHFEMVPITSRISRLFLGIQTQCTQCHDHPFDAKLKQNHFWGINAFLRQVRREGTPPMMRMDSTVPLTLKDDLSVNNEATVYFEKRNGVILPARAQFLDGTRLTLEEREGGKVPLQGLGRRQELARLITEHPNFGKALVNRMWGHFFGKGFVNPIDDFNDQNTPSHPELLEELGAKFKHYGFDQKALIRWIANSQGYQLSSAANKTNEKPENDVLFSRMLLKSMSPETLFESLMTATLPPQSKDAKKDLRNKWLGELITNFGDDEGNEVSYNGTIVQALMMMNGADLNGAIAPSAAGEGLVAGLVKKHRGVMRPIVTDLYLHALNRLPTARELEGIAKSLPMRTRDRDAYAPYQDLLWALVNSNEFSLNH